MEQENNKLNISNSVKDWTKSSIPSLELIHEKSNARFLHTTEENQNITSRCFTLITLLIPILTFALVALGRGIFYEDIAITNTQIIFILIIGFPSLICLVLLLRLVFPKDMVAAGRIPKNIALEGFIQKEDTSKEESYISLLIGEIEILQESYDFNQNINEMRLKVLQGVMKIILYTLVLTFIAFVVLATAF